MQREVHARLTLSAIEPFGKIGGKLTLGSTGLKQGEVDDVPAGVIEHKVGDELTGAPFKWKVPVLTTENDHGETGLLAIG